MAYHVSLECVAKTDTGMVRSHNEDFIAVSAEHGFVILADGMGGYSAGEVASSIAATVVQETLEERLPLQFKEGGRQSDRQLQQLVQQAVARANASIIDAAENEPQFHGMGTTVVVGLFQQDRLILAHVGDSRAYRLRDGELVQITRDHSLLQEQIDAGLITPEAALLSPNRNLITRAVGVDHEVDIEVHEHITKPGDIYLLCSDGLSDMLSHEEITATLKDFGADLESACGTLIQRANMHGGKDNISVILAKVVAVDVKSESLLDRVLKWVR
ncbi:Stp1/IreP family PP2C-type Ser/Thr phosphatase [Noviherbaspirillum sedimenti]|uniref:Stp1/IreP family PP2C-type Ser/Thr phosphatase n=1 Tax=Noviherbaspirillum sedimenti TaxID=2320865 RepID=A0A3A3G5U7_9BURK|nr:Stp1/IreP family PP2C-type Ser/Thr phosphatase [Noviherbaspirillum sedimenti]RJG03828.1 Stp1/IreP family PP2C-type Ser/Thr phosphatase [Noviherbaspirillum sedimenti]